MKKEVALSNNKYFELNIGKRILKKQIFHSKGKVPIYSANVLKPFGFLEEPNESIMNFKCDYVLWGIDGNFEFNVKHKGEMFAITDHCGAIKILDTLIIPEYLVYQLEIKKYEMGFDRTLRASLANMEKIVVSIPINNDDRFDISEQTRLILKFMGVKNAIAKIKVMYDDLKNTNLEVDIDTKDMLEIPVSELFDLSVRTNHSDFTKAFIDANKGNISVYSASKDGNSVDYGCVKDNMKSVKYFENCLTWNMGGSIGKAFYRKGRFTLSENVIPLVFRQKYREYMNPEYVKMLLEQRTLEYCFHYSKVGKGKIKDLVIPFPSKSKSEGLVPDLSRQKEIVHRYKETEAIRNAILDKLQELVTYGSQVIMD